MRPYRFVTPAYRDLTAALEYLGAYSSASASRFLLSLDRTLGLLARYPGMGRRRPEFKQPHLLFLVFEGYLIAYDPSTKPLTVVAIRYPSQDPELLFKDI